MTEIQQLKEEIAKLRERIAVLEAGKHTMPWPHTPLYPAPQPGTTPYEPWRRSWEITC